MFSPFVRSVNPDGPGGFEGYFASYLACWGPPDLFAPEEGTEWADAITDPFTELLARARLIVA